MNSATPPLIDPVQLNRHTLGNASLQVEVLALFVAETERLMRQVEDAPSPQIREDRLRALIGVAKNTGAAFVVQQARALEKTITAEEVDLAPLRSAVADTLAYVRRSGI